MSRRDRGRFSTHTASETLQRQLTAPVHKWRKAWVAPSGIQAESSYKVCKWVRVNDKDVDDETHGVDGEDDDDEGENEEDEEENEDGEDGDGDVKPTSTSTPAAIDTTPATPAVVTSTEAPDTTKPTAAGNVENTSATIPPAAPAQPTDEPMPVDPAVPAVTETTGTDPVPAADDAAPQAQADPESAELAVPSTGTLPETHEHTSIPSNAIEITNTAPGHTEVGKGDLGGEAGIEITRPAEPSTQPEAEADPKEAVEPPQVGSLGQEEDKMEIDEPEVEKGEAPEEDAGLVMGEMAPPVGQEGLSVTDQDQVKEAETENKTSEGELTPPPP